jgi:hypothetical protein
MMEDNRARNIAGIRQFLLAAFTPEALRRFCRDRSAFRPFVASFDPGQGLDDMEVNHEQ